jgi:hypothetical protein
MGDVWLGVLEFVLRPARVDLARCLRERARHLTERKRVEEARTRAIGDCEQRIERARALVFAASDGVVGANMTDLEREWRRLSRKDPDGGVMDLWACIAPPAWIDRMRWRESAPAERADVAVALAADVIGVEAAEQAVIALRTSLEERGLTVGDRIGWRFFDHDRAHSSGLFPVDRSAPMVPRDDVHAAALQRFPDRPLLARDVALAAAAAKDPSAAATARVLRDLWKTGYVLSAIGPSGVILELTPIVPSD